MVKKLFILLSITSFLLCAYSCNKKKENIEMVFFYSPGCEDCAEAKEVIIPELEAKYSIKFDVTFYNSEEPENFEKIMEYEKKLNASADTIPTIVVNNKMISSIENIRTDLEKIVREMLD